MAEENKTETGETQEENNNEQPSIIESVLNTVSSTVSSVVEGATNVVGEAAQMITGAPSANSTEGRAGKRAQKIGIVSSDKMTKTVVVKVDRQVMHPKYRRYIRRTSKFMAHDEMGANTGDKVRIEESRPLSARKRWRVIEVIQKAAK
jgi:small subunit ribosomal protein S17